LTELELILLIIGVILTIFSWSYPYFGISRPFSFAEHLGIGGTAAVSLITLYQSIQSTAIIPISKGQLTLMVPFIVGSFVFSRLTKYRWIANYPVAIMTGTGVGLVFGTTITAEIISQIAGSISDLVNPAGSKLDPMSSILMFFTTIFTMLYFFYSKKISGTLHIGKGRPLVRISRILLYATFGNLYAKVLIADGLDFGLTAYLVAYIRRSFDQILTYFGVVYPF